MSHRKIAIVGTAPSWSMTPWDDTEMEIWSLNDAYNVEGFQRADVWFDLHPLDKLYYAPETPAGTKPVIMAHQVPYGYYVRPAKHLDWLAMQPFKKYLHPDFAKQKPEAANWPNVHAFPKAVVEECYGSYCTSSPQWMMGLAMLEGVREIHIYGIHLSTEQEYIEQRPGFEFLIGCLLGPHKRKMTVHNGLRHYESEDGIVVLPEASPVLASRFQYAFEPSPRRAVEPLKWELHKAEIKFGRTLTALRSAKGPVTKITEPIPDDPNGKTRDRWATVWQLQKELTHYDALVQDCHEAIRRCAMAGAQ